MRVRRISNISVASATKNRPAKVRAVAVIEVRKLLVVIIVCGRSDSW